MATTKLSATVQRICSLASARGEREPNDGELLGDFLARNEPSALLSGTRQLR